MKIISYIVLVLFLIVGGLAATYFTKSRIQDAKIADLESDLDVAEESLQKIQQSVATSDRVIATLSESLAEIDEKGSVVTERVYMLERNNEQVRIFLDTRLPESGCMLDDSCTATELRASKRSSANLMHSPKSP